MGDMNKKMILDPTRETKEVKSTKSSSRRRWLKIKGSEKDSQSFQIYGKMLIVSFWKCIYMHKSEQSLTKGFAE